MKNSYDVAFNLSHTLTLYKKRFSEDDNLIIYPSAWYKGFFELTLRDKESSHSNRIVIDLNTLSELLEKYVPSPWKQCDEMFTDYCTPLKLKFKLE